MSENSYLRPQHPVLLVITGLSGVGKDTIAQLLMTRKPGKYYFVVTATTRPPREGEQHGVDYFFLSNDEFAGMIDEDEFLEWAVVYNDYKGVPKQQIRDALAAGTDVIMRVDVQGAATIKKILPEATLLFMSVESEETMIQRLKARRSETDASLSIRIATARKEILRVPEYDYYVVNYQDKQDETVAVIESIISAERHRVSRKAIVL